MKYQAKPVIVDAFEIAVVQKLEDGRFLCKFVLPDLNTALNSSEPAVGMATPDMTSRMVPKAGDYWIIQSDGYVYLNPKEVFERKYGPVDPNALELGAAARRAGIVR